MRQGVYAVAMFAALVLCLNGGPARAAQTTINLGPFSAALTEAAFSYTKTNGAGLTLGLTASEDLMGHPVTMQINGLHLDKNGLKDASINVTPGSGSSSLLDAAMGGADVKITGATVNIQSNHVSSFTLAGSITIEGNQFQTTDLTKSGTTWTATLTHAGNSALSLGGVAIDFKSNSKINLTIQGSNSFKVDFTNFTLDFSSLAGTQFKVDVSSLSYDNGSITANTSLSKTITVEGVSLDLSSVNITSPAPAGGSARQITVSMNGTMDFNIGKQIAVGFNNLTLSSDGSIGGNITMPNAAEFNMFGMNFTVTGVHMSKPKNGTLSFSMDGHIGSGINFTGMSVSNSKLTGTITIPANSPLQGPWDNFISIKSINIADNNFTFDGSLDLPSPLSKSLPISGVTVSSTGALSNITVKNVSIPLDQFNLSLGTLSYDVSNKTINMSGDMNMPTGVLDKPLTFSNLSFSTAGLSRGGEAQPDASKTTSSTSSANDTKHKVSLSISSFSFGKDSTRSSGKFFVNLSGSMGVSIDTYGANLNFTNLKIFSNGQLTVGTVTGGVKIAGYGVEVSSYNFDDSGSDPSFVISGSLTIPEVGSLAVQKLQVFKSGAVSLQQISISLTYPSYQFSATVSYVNHTVSGAGTIQFGDKSISADAVFGPGQWGVDITVSGLDVELFPGVTLYSVGGGVHYWANHNGSSNVYEFNLNAGLGFPSKDTIYASVGLTVWTTGIVDISVNSIKLFDSMNIGSANLSINIPQKTLTGTLNFGMYVGPVYINATLNAFLGSATNWYVSGNGTAKLFNMNSLQMGNASFTLNNNGFRTQGSFGLNVGSAGNVSFSFDFTSPKSGSPYGSLNGSAHVNFAGIATANGNLTANYSGNTFSGSLYLSACINICWAGCSWHWVDHCCCSYDYCCGNQHWWQSCNRWCTNSLCVSTYDSYDCSWCYSTTSSCASTTLHLTIDSNGPHVSG